MTLEHSYSYVFLTYQILSLESVPRSDIAYAKNMYILKTIVKVSPKKAACIYITSSNKTPHPCP